MKTSLALLGGVALATSSIAFAQLGKPVKDCLLYTSDAADE